MEPHQIIGSILLATGFLEPALGFLILAPHWQAPQPRWPVLLALTLGGLAMIGLGTAFLLGAFAHPPQR